MQGGDDTESTDELHNITKLLPRTTTTTTISSTDHPIMVSFVSVACCAAPIVTYNDSNGIFCISSSLYVTIVEPNDNTTTPDEEQSQQPQALPLQMPLVGHRYRINGR